MTTPSSTRTTTTWTDKDVLQSNFFKPSDIQSAYLDVVSASDEGCKLSFFWSTFTTNYLNKEDKNRYMICGASDGYIYVYSFSLSMVPNAHHAQFRFLAHEGPVYCYEWVWQQKADSQDASEGVMILFTGGDQEMRSWNISQLIQQTQHIAQNNNSSVGGTTLIEDVQFLKEMRADERYVTDRKLALERVECNALRYDAQNDKLFSAWGDGCVYVWDVESGMKISKIATNDAGIMPLSLVLSKNLLLVGLDDGTVKVFDTESEELVSSLGPFGSGLQRFYISALAVDPNNNWVVIGGGACFLIVMHLETREVVAVLPTSSHVNSVLFTDDGQIISVGDDRFISIWNMSGQLCQRFETELTSIRSVDVQSLETSSRKIRVLTAMGSGRQKFIYINDQFSYALS